MKLGAENKNKTIIAVVLAGLALLSVIRWAFMPGSSNATASAPRISAPAPIQPDVSAPAQAKKPASRRQESHSEDLKTLSAAFTPSLDPRLNLPLLKSSEDVVYEGKGRNIFQATPEHVDIPKPVAPARLPDRAQIQPGPKLPPPPPPINLKFFGFATNSGQKTIFLLQGDTTFVAREGDIIARRYKIVRIGPTSVEVQDLLSNNKQTIALMAG